MGRRQCSDGVQLRHHLASSVARGIALIRRMLNKQSGFAQKELSAERGRMFVYNGESERTYYTLAVKCASWASKTWKGRSRHGQGAANNRVGYA